MTPRRYCQGTVWLRPNLWVLCINLSNDYLFTWAYNVCIYSTPLYTNMCNTSCSFFITEKWLFSFTVNYFSYNRYEIFLVLIGKKKFASYLSIFLLFCRLQLKFLFLMTNFGFLQRIMHCLFHPLLIIRGTMW